jgi:hypothetical protein
MPSGPRPLDFALPKHVQRVVSRGNAYLYDRTPGRARQRISEDEARERAQTEAAEADALRKSEERWTPARVLTRLLYGVTARAVKNGIPCDLTAADLQELFDRQDGRCAICGIAFDFSSDRGPNERLPFAPSVDRIVPALGYVRGNVRLTTVVANYAMSDWGEEPVRRFARALLKHRSCSPKP